MTLSRAISAAPTGTRTAFSAYSVTRSTGVFASSARVSAALRAAVLRLRAVAAWLRERVWAAFLAAVDRLVVAVFRVVVAVVAMRFLSPSYGFWGIDRTFVAYHRTCVCKPPERNGYTPVLRANTRQAAARAIHASGRLSSSHVGSCSGPANARLRASTPPR